MNAMQRSCQLWETGQKAKTARVLAGTEYTESGSFWQFCQAVAECLLNRSKEIQMLEGLWMGKDGYLRDSADIVEEMKKPKMVQKKMFDD